MKFYITLIQTTAAWIYNSVKRFYKLKIFLIHLFVFKKLLNVLSLVT